MNRPGEQDQSESSSEDANEAQGPISIDQLQDKQDEKEGRRSEADRDGSQGESGQNESSVERFHASPDGLPDALPDGLPDGLPDRTEQ